MRAALRFRLAVGETKLARLAMSMDNANERHTD